MLKAAFGNNGKLLMAVYILRNYGKLFMAAFVEMIANAYVALLCSTV